ncbi:MAG: flagellar export protein FliJ [Planctomycetota bacterium]|jgi:flagellar FliJ protein
MAKRFKFNLDTVLKIRENTEKDKLLDFSKAQSAVIEKQNQIERMDESRRENQDMIAKLYKDKANVHDIVDYYRYINNLESQKFYTVKQLQVSEFEMEQKRAVYLEARKKRRALDLLKEKRFDEHIKAENHDEARQLDDLVIQRKRSGDVKEDESNG